MQAFVTPAEFFTFFKEIHVMWVNMGEYADLATYHVVDEILDMVKLRQALPQLQLPDWAAQFTHCLGSEMQTRWTSQPCLTLCWPGTNAPTPQPSSTSSQSLTSRSRAL
ncbi:hypothetical protein V8C86DRAFT_623193 [Haematococcus lacustris]